MSRRASSALNPTISKAEESSAKLDPRKQNRTTPLNYIETEELAFKPQDEETRVFFLLKKKWVQDLMIKRLKSLIPMHRFPRARPKQQWQKTTFLSGPSENKQQPLLKDTDFIFLLVESSLLIIYCTIFLIVTVKDVFEIQPLNSALPALWIAAECVDIFVQLNTGRMTDSIKYNLIQNIKVYIKKDVWSNVACWCCAVDMLVKNKNVMSFGEGFLFSVMAAIGLVYQIRIKIPNLKSLLDEIELGNEFKIAKLFIFVLLMGHIFGTLLYSFTYLNPDENWCTRVGLAAKSWKSKYLYSLYWAITTMVTVGYGDISPTNEEEVCLVMLIELLGTAIFGYMINVIGLTVSQMNDVGFDFQYAIDETRTGARDGQQSIQSPRSQQGPAFPHQEVHREQPESWQEFQLRRLQPDQADLEQPAQQLYATFSISQLTTSHYLEILTQSQSKVILRSIFFLTNFSKLFNLKLAMKLTNRVYQPNEFLQDSDNMTSTFIIAQGSVSVLAKRGIRNRFLFKQLKTINEIDNNSGVQSNVYGYSKMVLNRDLLLSAKSESFVVASELTRKDFLQILQNFPMDLEGYFCMRDRFYMVPLLESIEGHVLDDPRFHYCPRPWLVIRKYIFTKPTYRTFKTRRHSRFNSKAQLRNWEAKDYLSLNSTLRESKFKDYRQFASLPRGYTPEVPKYQSINAQDDYRNFNMGESLMNQQINQMFKLKKQTQGVLSPQELLSQFDSAKKYDRYWKKFNVDNVIFLYNKYVIELKKKGAKRRLTSYLGFLNGEKGRNFDREDVL